MTVTSFLRDMRWSKFDVGIAAFAAASACFVAYAAPDWRLYQLIFTLRLNDVIPALEPPIGNKIRLAAMVGSAALAFAAVFALMQVLDRVPGARRRGAGAVPEVLHLRRADAHPDAPARRPLLARRELGEPAVEPEVPEEAVPEAREAKAAPAVPAPERAIPPFLAVEQPEEAVEAEPEAPEAEAEPETLDLTEVAVAPEPLAAVAQPVAEGDEVEEVEDCHEVPKAGPGQAHEEADGESLSMLMRRLETGIGRRETAAEPARPARHRREQALPPVAAEVPAPAAPAAEEPEPPARHRLRSAIQDLEKLAGSR